MLKALQIKTECCSQDVSTPDSYSGRPVSKSRFGDWPSCFRSLNRCLHTLHIAQRFN
jgi:hypothetical protein